MPRVPSTPSIQPAPSTPDIPPAPSTPDIPPAPSTPDIPPVPSFSGIPPVPSFSGIPPVPSFSGIPPAPSTPDIPPAPSFSGIPPVPSFSGIPPVPSFSGIPPVPSFSGIPPAPSIPGIPPVPSTQDIPPAPLIPAIPPTPVALPAPTLPSTLFTLPVPSTLSTPPVLSTLATPSTPSTSATPSAPSVSATPSAPSTSATPSAPSTSATPSAPSISATPSAPSISATPSAPSISVTPSASSISATPFAPSTSATPSTPITSATPSAPSTSVTPPAPSILPTPPASSISPTPPSYTAASSIPPTPHTSSTPPTPISPPYSALQTNYSEDGIFKISQTKTKEELETEAAVARRTRSKLSLSHTPLEVIEEAFVPPDITTDMYDMDCDNDDWTDFLKNFTKPLDEVVKGPEDDEMDPEYNILADEEIDKVDKEELRVDRAVKISKKELNKLISELFEYVQFCSNETPVLEEPKKNNFCQNYISNQSEIGIGGLTMSRNNPTNEFQVDAGFDSVGEKEMEPIIFDEVLLSLIEQQMRQLVQILTQNFILTYQHPEFHHFSGQLKEYLFNLKYLCEGKQRSMFYTINLMSALNLVKYWEELLAINSDKVNEMKIHISSTLDKSLQAKQTGNLFIPTFSLLVLETIANSDVFLYPGLLPKIPLAPSKLYSNNYVNYTDSEDQLIALGLEQFLPLVSLDKKNLSIKGEVKLLAVCTYINEYLLTYREANKIRSRILLCKHRKCASNPIKYFYQHNKAPPLVHYVTLLPQLQVLPPCKRQASELPYQWKNFIYPPTNVITVISPNTTHCFANCTNLPVILSKGPLPPTRSVKRKRRKYVQQKRQLTIIQKENKPKIDPITKFVSILKSPSHLKSLVKLFSDDTFEYNDEPMNVENHREDIALSNMPYLKTPLKTNENMENGLNKKASHLDFLTISSVSFQNREEGAEIEFCEKMDVSTGNVNISVNEEVSGSSNNFLVGKEKDDSIQEKDNIEDIQALLVASSNLKPTAKKEPSGAEKKRAKIRKEFLANLSLTTPEDPEIEKQKDEMFAMAYYDKMRETLDLEDYHKVMQVLNDHEDSDAVDLYMKMEKILKPKYEELAEEFLLFLREKQAAAVNQLIPWIKMNNRTKFLRKLEIYFKDQPAQLRKIYKCLTDLSQDKDNSMDKIKSTLLPMFKGNAIITDLFLQNFNDERPPQSLLEGPYETIDLDKELQKPDDEEPYETITVPDTDDKYGGPTCICGCHEIEDSEFKSRYRHCIKCGTRFINGKVFIQTGRGLRPATVSFPTNPNIDHNLRLMGNRSHSNTHFKKRFDTNPSKQMSLSPTKENPDEDTDDERYRKKSKSKSPRKRKKVQSPDKSSNIKDSPKNCIGSKKSISSSKSGSVSPSRKKRNDSIKRSKEKKPDERSCGDEDEYEKCGMKPGSILNQQKSFVEEASDLDDNILVGESSSEQKPTSPEQNTAESESEFCEESSQDNCESDSTSSTVSDNIQSQSDSNVEDTTWKREEDKIILETFQKENDKEDAFRAITQQLKNRNSSQIKKRFNTLMTLLIDTIGNS